MLVLYLTRGNHVTSDRIRPPQESTSSASVHDWKAESNQMVEWLEYDEYISTATVLGHERNTQAKRSEKSGGGKQKTKTKQKGKKGY